jgi:hypothetical protein
LKVRHVAPGRCMLRQPMEAGEVQRIPPYRPDAQGRLQGYYLACPSCGLRRLELPQEDAPFAEGEPVVEVVEVEDSAGELHAVRHWVPRTVTSTRTMRCMSVRCGVDFVIHESEFIVVGSRAMDSESHALLSGLDLELSREHMENVRAWQTRRKAEQELASKESSSMTPEPPPKQGPSVRQVLMLSAMEHKVTLHDLVCQVIGIPTITKYEPGQLLAAGKDVPESFAALLNTLKSRWPVPALPALPSGMVPEKEPDVQVSENGT